MGKKREKQEVVENNQANNKYNFALYIPEKKNIEWNEENGIVTLTIKVNDPVKKFLAWMVKRAPQTQLHLDERCSAVWIFIDGERTIYDIGKLMSKKYGTEPKEEVFRLVTYLKYIAKRGWIRFKYECEDGNLENVEV
ncbi:MAG: PqqD family peptide modification chaperone [Clostridium sp.]